MNTSYVLLIHMEQSHVREGRHQEQEQERPMYRSDLYYQFAG